MSAPFSCKSVLALYMVDVIFFTYSRRNVRYSSRSALEPNRVFLPQVFNGQGSWCSLYPPLNAIFKLFSVPKNEASHSDVLLSGRHDRALRETEEGYD